MQHVGDIHRSWAAVAHARATDPRDVDRAALRYSADKGDLVQWYEDGLLELLQVLRDTPDDARFWTFDPTRPAIAFLRRRMAHETAVHRWDCEAAYGDPAPIPPRLAADGIDELLTVYLPAWGAPNGGGETVALEAADTGSSWWLRIGNGTLTTARPAGDADALVRASANDLLLALWGRRPLDDLATAGDLGPLRRLLSEADLD